jgi:hypothetical protein
VPDWLQFLEEHLRTTGLSDGDRGEVLAELASHLEEVYEQHCARGIPGAEAASRVQAEVTDWHTLARRIKNARREEGLMNHRTKSVWIPGLVSLTLASGALAVLQVWGVRPHIVWTRSGLALLFYIPWLVAQPVIGAIGAYISRQNGGDWRERLTASLLPAGAMVGAFCVALCIAIVSNDITDYKITAIGLSMYIVSWAVLPALALAVGALPFLGRNGLERAS